MPEAAAVILMTVETLTLQTQLRKAPRRLTMSFKTGAAKVDAQMDHHALLAAEPVAYPPTTYAPQKKRIDVRELRFKIDTLLYNWEYATFHMERPISSDETEWMALMLLMKGEFMLLNQLLELRLIDKVSMKSFVDYNMKDKMDSCGDSYYMWTLLPHKQLLTEAESKERLAWVKS